MIVCREFTVHYLYYCLIRFLLWRVKCCALLNEIITQLHLGVIHIFTDGMFFIFAAD